MRNGFYKVVERWFVREKWEPILIEMVREKWEPILIHVDGWFFTVLTDALGSRQYSVPGMSSRL